MNEVFMSNSIEKIPGFSKHNTGTGILQLKTGHDPGINSQLVELPGS